MNKVKIIVRYVFCFLSLTAILSGALPLVQAQKLSKESETKLEEKTPSEKVSEDLQSSSLTNTGGLIKVVVQFKDEPSLTARQILSSSGARIKRKFTKLNTLSISLTADAIAQLSALSEVEFISPEREVQFLGHVSMTTGADAVRTSIANSPTGELDGSGIGIAILDSGMYESHKSFLDADGRPRIVFSQDFTGELNRRDPYGHGTHVAALAAGNGQIAGGAYQGIASNAKILNLRVLNSTGTGRLTDVLSAIDWILANREAYNIRVVNMSLGMPAVDSYRDDPLCRAARRLADVGIVVVAAAGNNGKDASGNKIYGLIHSPGNEPSVLTVGASNTFGTDGRVDDGVTTYSSRGPTRSYRTDAGGVKRYDNLIKPDLVAPGNRLISANSEGNLLVTQFPNLDAQISISGTRNQMFLNGSSMSAPVVAGAAALLLQINPRLSPNMVKAILQYTAQPLAGFNYLEQGAGQLNIEGAVRVAKLVRTDLPPNPTLNMPMLTVSTIANQTTTINGQTFVWAKGISLGQTFVTGANLLIKYQEIYDLGVIVCDGIIILPNGVIVCDTSRMTGGVIVADQIQTSSAGAIGSGNFYISTLSLTTGNLILPGGVIVCDGVIVADATLLNNTILQALNARVSGDNTMQMAVVLDY